MSLINVCLYVTFSCFFSLCSLHSSPTNPLPQSTFRDVVGLSSLDASVGPDVNSDDEVEPSGSTGASEGGVASTRRKVDKRSMKEEQKRQSNNSSTCEENRSIATSTMTAPTTHAPSISSFESLSLSTTNHSSKSSKHSGKMTSSSAAAAATTATLTFQPLACVELMPSKSHASPASSSSSASLCDVKLHLSVRPNASCTELLSLGSPYGSMLELRLHAPPRDGQANKEVVRFIRQLLSLSSEQVEFLSGEKSREKTLLVKHVRIDEICKKLRELCPPPTQ